MYNVIPISAFKDNYIWLITSDTQKYGVIVDPGDAQPVISSLEQLQITPVAILLTHHHWDHSNGIPELQEHYPLLPLYRSVPQNSKLHIPFLNLTLTVLSIPGHTLDHVAYYGHDMLFCGDTLFGAGCGRLFEGTAEQMYESLSRLANLPETTKVYCGHEYTEKNLRFAQRVEPHNPDIAERLKTASQLKNTLPSSIALEKQTNPFLRCQEAAVIASAEKRAGHVLTSPAAVFQVLRAWKDELAS